MYAPIHLGGWEKQYDALPEENPVLTKIAGSSVHFVDLFLVQGMEEESHLETSVDNSDNDLDKSHCKCSYS